MFADRFVDQRVTLPYITDFSVSFQVFGSSLKLVDLGKPLLDDYIEYHGSLG